MTITEREYRFSKDRFGKALCRTHQDAERVIQRTQDNSVKPSDEHLQEMQIKQNTKQVEESEQKSKEKESESKIGLRGIIKKVAVTTGKVIKKSATTITDTAQKAIQIRRWKDKILKRLEPAQIKLLAYENRIRPELVDKPTNDDYIDAIKNGVSLDDIIAFAKRNHVNIRDVLAEREELKIKEDNREIRNDETVIKDFYNEVVEAIKLFKPFQSYSNELPYQIELATYLRSRFQNKQVDIEQYRLSSRPDITIDGMAIEVKGPTGDKELETIANKCLLYGPSHPKGLIIVLFNISVGQFRYEEWFRNMHKLHPDVKIISK